MNPEIFKAYDIRGVYPDEISEEDAWKVGHATARFLPSLIKGYERGRAESTALCVGRDMRTHSEPLAMSAWLNVPSSGLLARIRPEAGLTRHSASTGASPYAFSCWVT